jgi:hypothetical protein
MKRFQEVIPYLAGIVVLVSSTAYGQGYVENALLFSSNRPGGSARMLGIGGAQIALGGDYSSALSNPAGLGMFNRSEFSISPAINTYDTDASYFGRTMNDSKSVFNIPGLSYVHHMPAEKNGFLGGSIGASLTRTNDFHNIFRYEGFNPNSSIIDFFVDQANGYTTDQFDEDGFNYNSPIGLAYYNYLIGPTSTPDPVNGFDDEYFTDLNINTVPFQEETTEVKGSSNQWSISYGGNYQDKLFFGAGIGITTLRYKSHKTYVETYTDDPALEGMLLDEKLEIDGSGVNLTLGLIYRPLDFAQIGVSYLTPTYYELTSNYYAEMYSGWKNFDYYGLETLNDQFASTDPGGVTHDYTMTVPGKFSSGIAFISKYGFISGDVEWTNPGKARYSSDYQSMTSDNRGIRASYQGVMNYRVGAELRYSVARLRAGYGSFGNPWKNDNIRYDDSYWSLGGGVRLRDFYVDVAYQNRTTKTLYFPYIFSDGYADPVKTNTSTQAFVLTVGFTF